MWPLDQWQPVATSPNEGCDPTQSYLVFLSGQKTPEFLPSHGDTQARTR